MYITLLVVSFVLGILLKKTRLKDENTIYVFFMNFVFIVISTIRDITVGQDTSTYVSRFYFIAGTSWNNLSRISDIVDFEMGFIIYNKIISIIWNNHNFLFLMNSLIIITSIGHLIKKYSPNPWISYFLFITLGYFGETLNITRQMLALALLIKSVEYILNKKPIHFLLIVILASFFHITALSFIVVYPISKIKISYKYIIIVIGISAMLYLFTNNIIIYFIRLLGYDFYLTRLGKGSGSGMLLLLLLFLVCSLWYVSRRKDITDFETLFLHLLIISVMLNVVALNFSFIGRLMTYFTIFNIISVPIFLAKIKKILDRYLIYSIIITGLLYFYIFILMEIDGSGILPYIIKIH